MSEKLSWVLKTCGRCRNLLLLKVCAFYDYVEHISYEKSLLHNEYANSANLTLLVQLKHIPLL